MNLMYVMVADTNISKIKSFILERIFKIRILDRVFDCEFWEDEYE